MGPEAALGGPIGLLRTGDIIDIDAKKGTINVRLSKKEMAAAISFLESLTLIVPFLASISMISPVRKRPIGPPRAASGPT